MSFISKIGSLASRAYGWAASVAALADPYFEYVTLLLPGNGTNGAQNNTFLDSSTANSGTGWPITRNPLTGPNAPTQGTFSPFSQTGWGNYFSGSSQYLSFTDTSNNLDLGGSQASFECWVYPISTTNYQILFKYGGTGNWNTTNGIEYGLSLQSGVVYLYYNSSASAASIDSGATTVAANTWTHIAVASNASNALSLYVNGTRVATTTAAITKPTTRTSMRIGVDISNYANGYMSNYRFITGSNAYDAALSSITVPTSPVSAVTGTQLLTCQSNRFRDASTNNFTITPNNSPSVQAFSPFNPTSSWSAATNGGSGYFDGTGDYLSVAYNSALNLGTGDFTVEFWFYNTTTVGSPYDLYLALCGASGLAIYRNSSNKLVIDQNAVSNLMTSTNNVPQGQWTHIAVTRSGTALKAFMNGVQEASVTNSTNFSGTSTTTIFSQGASAYCTGYGSDLRIVKGTAVYTSAFTPPTAPLTATQSANTNGNPSAAITGTATSLLLNFTNAGIYDATSKNDLETVGDAQISTAISAKWGSGCMAFDGTGDYLLSPDQPIQRIGTGNFTIECWVYRNSSGTYGLVGKGTGTTGWLVSLNSSNQVVFTYGSSTITSTGTVSATTWTYIAVVREGTGTNQTKIYINGSNDGTGTVSTDFNQTNSLYVGADRTGGSNANVYLQDLRISNYARTITASPTAAFPTL